MANRETTPSQKATASEKSSSKLNRKRTGNGFNPVRFFLTLTLLVIISYAGLTIWESQLFPENLEEIELPAPSDDAENNKPADKTEESTEPDNTAKPAKKTNMEDINLYFTEAFDFAWPAYKADEAVIEHPYYTLRYSEQHEQAIWVAYPLWADSLKQKKHKRTNDFRKDSRVKTGSASQKDYRGSGYDRGNLAPAADFSYNEFALSQSFFMSNMSPQRPGFNRGIWKKLENQVRKWAMKDEKLYVVTGPVLNKIFKTIGENKVSVPDYYYKIVLDIEKPEIKAIAFLLKNERSSAPLKSFTVSIDYVEQLTGLDFFPGMPDEMEVPLESKITPELWFK